MPYVISYGPHKLWSSSHVASPDQYFAMLMISMRAAVTYLGFLYVFCKENNTSTMRLSQFSYWWV